MFHDARLPRIDAAPADALVLTVYRCAMAGFSCDQAACFDIGWQALLRDMPLDHASGLFGEFHHFVRTLIAAAERPLTWRPATCRGFSGDEARMLQMIEAAQRGDRRRLLEVAAALLTVDGLAAPLEATQSLANALAARGLFVHAGLAKDCQAACPANRRLQ
jgi:hypothetical protein